MKIKLFKVSGESMLPTFFDGDYVVTWRSRLSKITIGDVVAIDHPSYGLIIKRVTELNANGSCFVAGDNPNSTPQSSFGLIDKNQVLGKVIYHSSPR
ncbi:S24/S26 family peptidase [Sessilibacter corallicola]|uniref:S24/S26 family peptidase n=1 Tax=Sessilibacter corallicola TaxID=2904075 RepID=UPI00257464AA|nr:S24/S26 family peptidase [Sessilibacter corallicola]